MEQYDLKKLKRIAQGGEADIYDLGDKILRVPRKENEHVLETDRALYPILEEHSVSVPRVYGYPAVGGKAAEVMQKIRGCTMLDLLTKNPLGAVPGIRRLARMQAAVSEIEVGAPLHTMEEMVNYFIGKPPVLERELNDFVLKLFQGLPKGNRLCHGDFHPGNILTQDGVDYIIDWSGAYRSNPLSDVAHSFLLMKHVPHIPGESRLQHAARRTAGGIFANAYLKEARRLVPFDDASFSRWTVVMSFLRFHYGMPPERPERLEYIRTCRKLGAENVDAAKWYAKI